MSMAALAGPSDPMLRITVMVIKAPITPPRSVYFIFHLPQSGNAFPSCKKPRQHAHRKSGKLYPSGGYPQAGLFRHLRVKNAPGYSSGLRKAAPQKIPTYHHSSVYEIRFRSGFARPPKPKKEAGDHTCLFRYLLLIYTDKPVFMRLRFSAKSCFLSEIMKYLLL